MKIAAIIAAGLSSTAIVAVLPNAEKKMKAHAALQSATYQVVVDKTLPKIEYGALQKWQESATVCGVTVSGIVKYAKCQHYVNPAHGHFGRSRGDTARKLREDSMRQWVGKGLSYRYFRVEKSLFDMLTCCFMYFSSDVATTSNK